MLTGERMQLGRTASGRQAARQDRVVAVESRDLHHVMEATAVARYSIAAVFSPAALECRHHPLRHQLDHLYPAAVWMPPTRLPARDVAAGPSVRRRR